jgi:hypothetical protein
VQTSVNAQTRDTNRNGDGPMKTRKKTTADGRSTIVPIVNLASREKSMARTTISRGEKGPSITGKMRSFRVLMRRVMNQRRRAAVGSIKIIALGQKSVAQNRKNEAEAQ